MTDDRRARLRQQIDFLQGDFTLASGKKSNFYINGKTTTLRPEALNLSAKMFLELIKQKPAITRVGGLTLGADALIGAIVALSFDAGTPYTGFIVRKEPKGHGTGQWIEGPALTSGENIALIEDVVTTGGSSLQAIERVLATCPTVKISGVYALVDREDGGREKLAERGYELFSLFTKTELLG